MKHVAPLLLALSCALPAHAQTTISESDAARIVRAAKRLTEARPGARRFMVVSEMPSEKYVQFFSDNKVIAFDIPLSAALKAGVDLFHDADCSPSPPAKRVDEVETRYLSEEEEARLKAFLNAAGHAWKAEYCISESKEGQRVGYNASLVGRLANPKAVPPFIERVFSEVHRLPAVRAIEIETDE